MSLDVYLEKEDGTVLYNRNITHNLATMASEANIYKCLWRPEECGIARANQLIEPLTVGVALLATQKSKFEQFNSPNGWGTWEHMLVFCAEYLQACRDNPDALVIACR